MAKSSEHSETVIGSSIKVEGNFVGHGNIIVEGRVTGSMKTDQDLRIVPGAVVEADVEARNVFIAGDVRGNVKAHDRLELTESAKVSGDVQAKVVSIGAGASLNGKCTMLGAEAAVEEPGGDPIRERAKSRGSRPVEVA